jgi:hypothetical protein
MLFAQATLETLLAAFLEGANFVARLGHLALQPEPVMFTAIALGYNLTLAISRLTGSLIRHSLF